MIRYLSIARFLLRHRSGRLLVTGLLFLLFSAAISLRLAQAQPAGIVVNSFSDQIKSYDGVCTLREAVIAANSDRPSGSKAGECVPAHGPDTILLNPGVYTLGRADSGDDDACSTGDLDITSDISIRPRSAGLVVISGNGITDRVFHILRGTVTITGVTIRGGNMRGSGGGIFNAGLLTLENSTLVDSRANVSGGGLYNKGSATLANVTVVTNTAPSGSGLANGASRLSEPAQYAHCPCAVQRFSGRCQSSQCGQQPRVRRSWLWRLWPPSGTIHGSSRKPSPAFQVAPSFSPWRPAARPSTLASAPSRLRAARQKDQRGCPAPKAPAATSALSNAITVRRWPLTTATPCARMKLLNVPAPGVLENDSDADGVPLTAILVTGPSHGTLTLNGNGSFSYTPTANYNGSDSFTYKANDGSLDSNVATVSITSPWSMMRRCAPVRKTEPRPKTLR